MNKKGQVYYNDVFAGTLEYSDNEYVFNYDLAYINDKSLPPISLSFPKSKVKYRSSVLFPFFYGLLTEGNDKALQCAILKIDENDHFTRLLKTAGTNTIGAITVREVK
jgi:serine/threonine-protein kinase HipA